MPAQLRRSTVSFGTVVLVALASANCGDGTTAPTSSTGVGEYIGGLPSWDSFAQIHEDADTILETGGSQTEELVDGSLYECSSTPYSLTRTPDKVVTLDPDVNILWLGALLQGSGYKDGIGSLAEWSVRERAPMRVSIDLLSQSNTRDVERPDLASVNQAIGELVQAAASEGHRGGSSVSFSMQTTHSVRQATLSLGISTKYLGPKITADLDIEASASERTVTAYFVQRMFTASFVLPNTASDVFSADFTPDRLQEEIDRGHVGSGNLPVYVASIVYGRVMIFTFTSTARMAEIRAALSAHLGDEGGEISAERRDILQKADIRVITVGGEGRNAVDLIRSGQIADYFNEDAALTSARPISYTVRNLGDNSIARVSETTDYDLKECAAVPTTGQLEIDVTPNDATVSVVGPGGYTFGPQTGDQRLTELTPGGYSLLVTRTGFDTLRVETEVDAGETAQVPAALRDASQDVTGAIYLVTPKAIRFDDVSCAETLPDIVHSVRLNGRTIAQRTEADYAELGEGESDFDGRSGSTWTPRADTVFFSDLNGATADTVMTFQGEIWDLDGVGDNDLMGRTNFSYVKDGVPTGNTISRAVGANGCEVTFQFGIAKTADVVGS